MGLGATGMSWTRQQVQSGIRQPVMPALALGHRDRGFGCTGAGAPQFYVARLFGLSRVFVGVPAQRVHRAAGTVRVPVTYER